ncbi:MAG: hypothetical protein PHP46_04450 [Candidatus Omnitrophica bacterium]|nr:hypothetical protein [Candidatus Omnitrophota bacterium]
MALSLSLVDAQAQQQPRKETLQDKGKPAYLVAMPAEVESAIPLPYLTSNKLEYNASASVTQGYDNNVFLDPSRKDDSFTQEAVIMNFKYPFRDNKLNLKYGLDFTNITYYKITDASLLDWSLWGGFDYTIFDVFTLSPSYRFNMVWYPRDDQSSNNWNEFNLDLRQDLLDNFYFLDKVYHKGTYRLSYQNYQHRKARLGNGNLSSNTRADLRNTFDYEVGLYMFDSLIKVNNQIYRNDSDDQYEDYYDYNSYRLGCSIVHMFTDKFYSIGSFYWQKKFYDSRQSSQEAVCEKDDLYIVSSSLYYDITPHFSIFANYSYRENQSNEPLQKYSGSVVTAGIYYNF